MRRRHEEVIGGGFGASGNSQCMYIKRGLCFTFTTCTFWKGLTTGGVFDIHSNTAHSHTRVAEREPDAPWDNNSVLPRSLDGQTAQIVLLWAQ